MPQRFGRVTTPVYRQVGDDGLEHWGSGILIQWAERYWLVSAAHVLKSEGKNLWLGGSPKNFPLRGDYVWFGDPLDLAFTELGEPQMKAVVAVGNSFLGPEHIRTTDADCGDKEMVISGFPERAVELDGGERSVMLTPTNLRSRFFSPEELKLNRCASHELAGRFSRLVGSDRRMIRKMQMKGLSGGAIWHQDEDALQLVGIVKDFDPKRKLLVGSPISAVLSEINRRCHQ